MSTVAKTGETKVQTTGWRPKWRFGYRRQLYLLLLPFLLGMLVLDVFASALSVPMAFTDYDALTPPEWVGLKNFQTMFGDPLFWNGLLLSLFYIVVAVPLRVLGALLLAFLVEKKSKANSITRSIVYLPTIIPGIAYALLWLFLFNPIYGPLRYLPTLFGAEEGSWLLEPWPARFGIVLMMLWPIGEGFVLMLAALQDIPREIYDLSSMDGTNGLQRFFRITLPLIAPALLLLVLRDTISSFQGSFTPTLIVTEGGPYYATNFLPLYIYQSAFEYHKFGYASSMNMALYAVTALVVVLQFTVTKRWKDDVNAV